MTKETMDSWIAKRPFSVQEIAKKYPPGQEIRLVDHNQVVFVVGYGEMSNNTVQLWVSETNPYDDYDKAVATKYLLDTEDFERK